jgi:hypothetical protein
VEGKAGDETAVINYRIAGKFSDIIDVNKIVCFRNLKSSVRKTKHQLEVDRY